MLASYSLAGSNQFLPGITAQTVSVGALLPIVVLIILLIVIVVLAYRNTQKIANRPRTRPKAPSLSERNEELKKNLAELQARNQAELAQTRAILKEAQMSGDQVVNETREGVIRATREETERVRSDIIRAREENLTELRREGARIGQDEPPQKNPNGTNPA
jgi:biopolymer transport protein ExbB/TolQ